MDIHKDASILVTGGTGFLGSYLLRYLLHYGYKNVRGLKRTTSSMQLLTSIQDQVDWQEGDILDIFSLQDAMQGIEVVFHCAASISFDPREAEKVMEINSIGTANVVNAALYEGVKKLIYVSSIEALGKPKETNLLSEATKWQKNKGLSNYAISKYLGEQEAWRGMAEGLDVSVVIPSVVLGSGNWEDGPLKMFKLIWNNYRYYPTGLSGFVDVRDVARLMIQMMEKDTSGERFIANGENLSYQKILHEIATQLNRKSPNIRIGSLLRKVAWRAEWLRTKLTGVPPLLTRETANTTSSIYYYDNKKSIEAFSFSYTPISATIAAAAKQFEQAAQNGFEAKVLPLITPS